MGSLMNQGWGLLRRCRAGTISLLAMALVATGCGSTRSQAELRAAAGSDPPAAVPAGSTTAIAPDAGEGLPLGGEVDANSVPSSSEAPAAPASSSAVASSAPSGRGAAVPEKTNAASGTGASSAKPGSSSAPNGSGSKTNPTTVPGPGVPGSPSTPGGPAGSGGPKSPIVFGSIGTDSGILGEILVSALHGAKAWAADVNARGGLNGHPVRIVFGDDGGDPGRALSLAKGMVEQQGVIA